MRYEIWKGRKKSFGIRYCLKPNPNPNLQNKRLVKYVNHGTLHIFKRPFIFYILAGNALKHQSVYIFRAL